MTAPAAQTDPKRFAAPNAAAFAMDAYLADCRELTLREIRRFLPADTRYAAGLYEMMLDYPMRPAKALRPALCIGTCLALGGNVDGVLPSAAAFELFHNAFLVHDDVEDGSARRRHSPTLHVKYGVPIAVNVGDGMLALALEPLLDNVRALGLGPALRILRSFARMARESVEGQTIELDWIRARRWDLADREYLRMVHKKTGWYSFISPVQVGAIAAGVDAAVVRALMQFALLLGIAFQIQDDLLSLEGTEEEVGKDARGDLYEGKYTLPLLHTLRSLAPAEKQEALAILDLPRASAGDDPQKRRGRRDLFDRIAQAIPDLDPEARRTLEAALLEQAVPQRDQAEVARLFTLVTGRGQASLAHARAIARRHAERARAIFQRSLARVPDSVHKEFLNSLIDFVIHRSR